MAGKCICQCELSRDEGTGEGDRRLERGHADFVAWLNSSALEDRFASAERLQSLLERLEADETPINRMKK
jgi:hypothetical protein